MNKPYMMVKIVYLRNKKQITIWTRTQTRRC